MFDPETLELIAKIRDLLDSIDVRCSGCCACEDPRHTTLGPFEEEFA